MKAVRTPEAHVLSRTSASSDTRRPAGGKSTNGASSRGTVTAEFAVTLPAVVLLLTFLLAGSAAGLTQLRLEEAARGAARVLARGGTAAEVTGAVRQLAGGSAVTALAADGGWLSVTVSDRVPGAAGSLIPWTLSARAWARKEAPDGAAIRFPAADE